MTLPNALPAVVAETAISEELSGRAYAYAAKSHSPRTQKEYNRCWVAFMAWCGKRGRSPLPAGPETLAAYITWMADGGSRGKPMATSSINQAIAAIVAAHSHAGQPLDTKHATIQRVWKGARRTIARLRTIRRVKPLLQEDLIAVLDMLDPKVLREARDAAVLALGWGQARRCIELIGLDWHQLGSGTGFTNADPTGLTTTLMTSKTQQEGGEEYLLPRAHAAKLCNAVENWVAIAGIAPGAPLFRAVVGKGDGKSVSPDRLHRSALPRIMKHRIRGLAKSAHAGKRKLKQADLDAAAADYSSHSMRVGHVTSAANRRVPVHHIQKTTGHKTRAMIDVYSRATDAVENSSLKGSGLND